MQEKLRLRNYTWDIYCIAKEQNMQRDVACDMFIANLNAGKETYKGASGIDYEELGKKWKAMTVSEQHREKMDFNWIAKEYFKPLSEAWQAQNRKAFEAVVRGIE